RPRRGRRRAARPASERVAGRGSPSSEVFLRGCKKLLGVLLREHVEQRQPRRLDGSLEHFGQQSVVQLLVEDEPRIAACIFYLDGKISPARKLDRALEIFLRH